MSFNDPGFLNQVQIVGVDAIGGQHQVPVGNSANFFQLAAGSGILPYSPFNNVSGVGNGNAVDLVSCRSSFTMEVIAGAGVTAGVVALQGSLDNANWFNMGTVTTNAAGVFVVNVGNFPVRYVRAAITTAIVGGTVTAYIGAA